MKLNTATAQKLKEELGDKTTLSVVALTKIRASKIESHEYVPERYEPYRDKVQKIVISKTIKVLYLPVKNAPYYPMWIVEKK